MSTRDEATLSPESTIEAGAGERQVVATIAFHPELHRVGERMVIGSRATTVELSRAQGRFGRGPRDEGKPLDDPFVSRQPVRFRLDWRTGLVIAAAGSEIALLEGKPLGEPVVVTAAQLERGVELVLSRRVVLIVHLGGRPTGGRDHGMVGGSRAIERVRACIDQVADLGVPVLLRGETGVGKDLVARAIHAASPRAGAPCVSVNMATITAGTAASELFGHARGSFTGAADGHAGLFERADGGTIFLDEIGETPEAVQPMLLRVLECGEVLGVGSAQARRIDVRVIAATDADLEGAQRAGAFRAALLHRLAGFEIAIAPLRERRDDLGALVVQFLGEELTRIGDAARLQQQATDRKLWFGVKVMRALLAHDWPGNVRELRNVVRRLVVASRHRDTLDLDDEVLRLLGTRPPAPAPSEELRPGELPRERVVEALRAHGWAPGPAAAALGIPRSTLYDLIEKAGLRAARDLAAEELAAAFEQHGGDLDAMSASLQVSARGIKLRLREIGLVS